MKTSTLGVSLIIPCLNEEHCIDLAIQEAKQVLQTFNIQSEIIVVDNGSEDSTGIKASDSGVTVVHHSKRGYGEALRAGFAAARFEYVAFIDADLSYSIDDLPSLMRSLENGADFVLGNRLKRTIPTDAMPLLNRYIGTPALSWLIRCLHRIPTYDCNSGFRIIRKSHLMRMKLQAPGMELASEMLVKAAELKLNYEEVHISFKKDQRPRPSHLRRWRDGLRHLALIVRS